MNKIKKGDKVRLGYTVTVDKVLYCEYWGDKPDNIKYNEYGYPDRDWGWFCEFIDSNGNYHYWKQYVDGGELIRKED